MRLTDDVLVVLAGDTDTLEGTRGELFETGDEGGEAGDGDVFVVEKVVGAEGGSKR